MAEERIKEKVEPEGRREWTLMFYFASDNPLAPSMVSQLKALKGAGFHAGVNVVAHFDPHTRDTQSHVFEVNLVEKHSAEAGESFIGFDATNPFVRNLVLDKVWEEGDEAGVTVRGHVENLIRRRREKIGRPKEDNRKLPVLPTGMSFKHESSPEESLGTFLEFCRKKYPAERYMLFLIGHGVVVGNDIFLFDSNPGDDATTTTTTTTTTATATDTGNGTSGDGDKNGGGGKKPLRRNSLTLFNLRDLLLQFKEDTGSKLELLSFHSCSMSGAEVAFELRDLAHYMIASQGPAFVGSWPYRQILLRVFKGLDDAASRDMTDEERRKMIKEMVRDIFYYVVYNSYDFQLAGYPFDLALYDLERVGDLETPIKQLARALKAGLAGRPDIGDDPDNPDAAPDVVPLARELMLLAHWDAQSFWEENYTDLYDFCFRLSRRCDLVYGALKSPASLDAIRGACGAVMGELKKGSKGDDDRFIVRAEFVGSEYQYSHGLSIFFPWAHPAGPFFRETYKQYRLEKDTEWSQFLEEYFKQTLRGTRDREETAIRKKEESLRKKEESEEGPPRREETLNVTQAGTANAVERQALELLQAIGTHVFRTAGQLGENGGGEEMGPPGKIGSDDRSGDDDCDCPTFKNHPSFTGNRQGTEDKQQVSPTIGEGASTASAF